MTEMSDVLDADAIGEAIEESGGWWEPCSGCHESHEGVPQGAYSKALRTYRGAGCTECGGIGSIWKQWTAFDQAYYGALGAGKSEAEALKAAEQARDADPLSCAEKKGETPLACLHE
jgi:hypothetical protein